jgi:hypothetical protein
MSRLHRGRRILKRELAETFGEDEVNGADLVDGEEST